MPSPVPRGHHHPYVREHEHPHQRASETGSSSDSALRGRGDVRTGGYRNSPSGFDYYPAVAGEDPWYTQLRARWQPASVRVLLVGESAPNADADPSNRRFFYSDRLTGHDLLFRAVIEAVYDVPYVASAPAAKTPWLRRLCDDGYFLIDLVPHPVSGFSETRRAEERARYVGDCVAQAQRLHPDGIVVCHTGAFAVLNHPLRAAGLRLLHDRPIPFPMGKYRAQFVQGLRQALALGDESGCG
jgi:hypothetical protein